MLLRFHYVFLVVSAAVCGLGIGGAIDYAARRCSPRRVLATAAAALAALSVACVVVIFATPVARYLTNLWVMAACTTPAFVAAGAFLSRAFSTWPDRSGALYAADLAGAAAAAVGVVLLLQLGGGVNAILWSAALAALAAGLVAPRGLPLGILAALALAAAGAWNLNARALDIPAVQLGGDWRAKPLYQELADPTSGARVIYSEWNALARTDAVRYDNPRSGLISDIYIYTDGEVPTNIIPFDGDLEAIAHRFSGFIGLYAFQAIRPRTAMLLGPGGGMDVLLALLAGVEQIDGAEVNPSILRIVRRFRDVAGPVYDYANVNVVVADGRSFVRAAQGKWDMIYMALSKAATTSSASMALIESYIYTVQAFRDYLHHLTDRGAVVVIFQSPHLLVREALTAVEALICEGASRPQAARSICMAQVPQEQKQLGPYRYLLMVFRRPLTQARSEELMKRAVAVGLVPVYFPGVYEPVPWDRLKSARPDEFARYYSRAVLGRAQPLDVRPCTDDRPFFVDLNWGVPGPLRNFTAGVAILSAAALAASALLIGPAAPAFMAYFALLGVGFMLVEIPLIQSMSLQLGYPVLSLTVVLFGLLLGAGGGSFASQRVPTISLGLWVPAMCAAGAGLAMAAKLASDNWLAAGWILSGPVSARCLTVLAVVVPVGVALGFMFPSGIRLTSMRLGAGAVAWAWLVNGIFSVLGSSAATAGAKLWGFSWVLAGAGGIYVVAGALYYALWRGWRAQQAGEKVKQ